MKLLSSPRSCDDNDFVVAGGPLVSEWPQLKKKGRVARREAAKAAAAVQKAEAEREGCGREGRGGEGCGGVEEEQGAEWQGPKGPGRNRRR